MKKTLIGLVAVVALVGCGGSNDTYIKEAPAVPDEATNGTTLIITADNGSSTGVSYTEVGDGSVLVNCGDNCGVYIGTQVDPNNGGAGTNGVPTPAPLPSN